MKGALCFLLALIAVSCSGYAKSKKRECAVPCPRIRLPPVCGSNRNTYPNYCILKETACQLGQRISIAQIGPCKPKCSAVCTRELNPQCGTDGKTYSNPCIFKYAQCQSEGKIRFEHHGKCEPKPKKCSGLCRGIIYPVQVCGSDGFTYPNSCMLKITACQFDDDTKVAHNGPCDPKCRNICTLEYNPQCGTDGKTYGNPCQFRGALCESDGHVKLAHHGECKPKPRMCVVPCSRIRLPSVCGSDGNTYPNYCILKETACQLDEEIKIAHRGPCRPKCSAVCTREYNPQCGTDGKTYSNPCTFKHAQCQSDAKVRFAHHGKCNELRKKSRGKRV